MLGNRLPWHPLTDVASFMWKTKWLNFTMFWHGFKPYSDKYARSQTHKRAKLLCAVRSSSIICFDWMRLRQRSFTSPADWSCNWRHLGLILGPSAVWNVCYAPELWTFNNPSACTEIFHKTLAIEWKMPLEQNYSNIHQHGNPSSCTIVKSAFFSPRKDLQTIGC